MEFLILLKEHAAALTVIFTCVVTLSTLVYAVLTARLVSETRRMREVQTEPKIHITIESFEFSINIVRLNIQNIGLGPANNLQFETSVVSGENSAEILLQEFTKSNFFNTGLRYFGPGRNIYSTYTHINNDHDGKMSSMLAFKVKYKSSTGKQYQDEIILDMSELKGSYRLGKPNMYSIAKSLEKIQKDIHEIVRGSKRVKADIYLSEDRRLEEEELERMYASQTKELKNLIKDNENK